jgi:predicted Zn finger-like uncharacterized protein
MILTCPACSTRFAVDEGALGPSGRRVRCGSCKHVWHQAPPEIEDEPFPAMLGAAAETDATAAAEPVARDEAGEPAVRRTRPMRPPPAPPPRRRGAGTAWAVLILVLAVVVGGGWAFRDRVVQAWPDARRIYGLVGIAVEAPGTGLELRKVTWKRDRQDGVSVLLVEGEVANVSKEVREVPRIRGALFGGGREVQHWEFAPSQAKLLPGESVHFRTVLRNPAAAAERLTMNFSDK